MDGTRSTADRPKTRGPLPRPRRRGPVTGGASNEASGVTRARVVSGRVSRGPGWRLPKAPVFFETGGFGAESSRARTRASASPAAGGRRLPPAPPFIETRDVAYSRPLFGEGQKRCDHDGLLSLQQTRSWRRRITTSSEPPDGPIPAHRANALHCHRRALRSFVARCVLVDRRGEVKSRVSLPTCEIRQRTCP